MLYSEWGKLMGIRLIENGKLTGKIAVSPRAWEYEREAAERLTKVLGFMTQEKLEVSHDIEGVLIVIGSAMFYHGERQREFDEGEYEWYTKNGKVFIDGNKDTLWYAVCDFLGAIGCISDGDEIVKIPVFSDLGIPEKERFFEI